MIVTSAVKRIGAEGSVAKRQMAEKKTFAVFENFVDETFSKKAAAGKRVSITEKELKSFFKNLFPNMNLGFKRNNHPSLKYILDKENKKIIKLELNLPFSFRRRDIRKNDLENLMLTGHEIGHLTRAAEQPKYSARFITNKLSSKKDFQQSIFYGNYLHDNEIEYLSALEERTVLMDKKTRIINLKKEINHFFYTNNFSTEEKIETLQIWRHGLNHEFFAVESGFRLIKKYSSADEDIEALCKKSLEEKIFYPEKIKIIEQMLTLDIKQQRGLHLLSLTKGTYEERV